MRSSTPRPPPRHVTIVANTAETIQALRTYLEERGVVVDSTRFIERCAEMTALSSSAIVLFPDDYAADVVRSALSGLRASRPAILVVVVTSSPQTYARAANDDTAPLVIPRPAWGWSICDAIYDRLETTDLA